MTSGSVLSLLAVFLYPMLAQVSPAPGSESHLGILFYTFGLMLIVFLLMNLDRRFRDHAGRSLFRPFNFFADIRDGRLVPNGPTAVLALVIAGAVGIAVATLINGYPRAFSAALSSGLDYLSLVIWSTAISFGFILLIAMLLRFSAIFVRGRIYFSDTWNIAVWSLFPIVLLLFYDLILPRMDMDGTTATVSAIVLATIFLWSYFRILKGTGVLFDVYPTKIYIYGAIFLGIVALVLFTFFQKWGIMANFSFNN